MAIDSKTPLALYKANLELVLRLGTLLQENRRRWNQLGASSTSEAIERSLAETERMLTSNDWASLSAMPGEDFWKSMRDEAGPLQGTAQVALANQAAFAEGLREAFSAWQQQSVDALGEGEPALGKFNLAGFMNLFQVAQAAEPTAAKVASGAKPRVAEKATHNASAASERKKASKSPAKKKTASTKTAERKKGGARKPARSAGKRR